MSAVMIRMAGAVRPGRRRMRRGRLAAAVLGAALLECIWTARVMADDAVVFAAVYEAAETARQAAAQAGSGWRDTRKILRRARKQAQQGDYAKAIALARKAKRQVELSIVQAREQGTAWRGAVVR